MMSGKTKLSFSDTESIYLLLTGPDGNVMFANKAIREKFRELKRPTSAIHLSEIIFNGDREQSESVIKSILSRKKDVIRYEGISDWEEGGSLRNWFFYPLARDLEKPAGIVCVSSIEDADTSELPFILPDFMHDENEENENSVRDKQKYPSNYVDLLLTHTDNAFLLLDTEFRIVFFNRAAADFYRSGFNKELFEGLSLFDIIPVEIRANRLELLNNTVLKGTEARTIGYLPSGDGKRVLQNSYFPILSGKSDVTGICLISVDITEKEKVKNDLEKSENFFQSLISDSLDGIILVNTSGEILYAAPSTKKVLGFDPSELKGKNCFEFVHPEDLAVAKAGFNDEVIQKPRADYYEIRLRKSDGDWAWMMVRAHNMFDNAAVNSMVIFFSDITPRIEADKARKEAETHAGKIAEDITHILHSITDGFVAFDNEFKVILWNHVSESFTGIASADILSKNIWSVFPQYTESRISREFSKAMKTKSTANFIEYIPGLQAWLEFSAYPSAEGLFVYFRDITKKKRQEKVLELERQVFQKSAKLDSTLKKTVDFFLNGIERIYPDMICSVLLLDEKEKYVIKFSAPNLPKKYFDLVDAIPIGPDAGTCGTAAFNKKMVIVSDIATDPLWNNFREPALEHDLKACWSVPIMNQEGKVLATIAVYYKAIQSPTEEEISTIGKFAGVIGILLERERASEQLRISNERYKYATKATNEAIWDWDLKTNEIYWSDGFRNLFGYNLPQGRGDYKFWLSCVHPNDRNEVNKIFKEVSWKNVAANILEAEYRFLKENGDYAHVVDRAYLIFDENGEAIRMVGSMRDITEYKKLQTKVVNQELSRQKLFIEATIGAQEKERAEIGKELHDNINQVLSTTKLYLDLAKSEEGRRLELLQMSSKNINYAINEIRNLSHSLVPPSLKDLGLVESIFDVIAKIRMTQTFNINFDFSDLSLEDEITLEQKLTLYRIVQEQLNNIIKHADASNVLIYLCLDNGIIRLLIEDDGVGFNMEKTKKGVGLNNICNRAEFHEGTVELDTMPGKGCKLVTMIPAKGKP